MLNQFFGSCDTKWAYVLLKKLFSNKKIDFLKITYKNVQSFNLVHVQEANFFFFLNFVIGCSDFVFVAPFVSFFSVLLLLLTSTLRILSSYCKKFHVN